MVLLLVLIVVVMGSTTGHPTATRRAYSANQAAEILGCTLRHIRQMISTGELRSFKLGRKRLIPAAAIEELLGEELPADLIRN